MKKLRLLLILALTVLGAASCTRHKREKITDPVQQEVLRTRDQDLPVDSLFTKQAAAKIASPFKRIAIGKLFAETKEAYSGAADKAARQKYAEKLEKEDKMDKDKALKKAAKADSTTLAEHKANLMERIVVTGESLPGDGYSPSLTTYFLIVLIAFAILFTIRVIKAFFVSPKKK